MACICYCKAFFTFTWVTVVSLLLTLIRIIGIGCIDRATAKKMAQCKPQCYFQEILKINRIHVAAEFPEKKTATQTSHSKWFQRMVLGDWIMNYDTSKVSPSGSLPLIPNIGVIVNKPCLDCDWITKWDVLPHILRK